MQFRRENESGDIPVRSERIFDIEGEWYFAIRRGKDQGPFRSKHEAQAALRVFILEALNEQNSEQQEKPRLKTFFRSSLLV